MSNAPLQEFFDILNMFSSDSYGSVNSTTKNLKIEKVKSLIEQGCLNGKNTSILDGHSFIDVSLTPRGAVMLSEWGMILRKHSVKGRIFSIMERITWIGVGVLATIIGKGLA